MGNVWLFLREACMRMTTTSLAFAGVLLALTVGTAAPGSAPGSASGSAAVVGCNKQPNQGLSSPCGAVEFAAQTKRPRVTIYRRYVNPRPNALRQCYSWLAREYRVSGPVITPQMRCWWE
jgi:hypothetical protein